ncbi:MAG: protein kinase, partial [Dokdonella sp.]
DVGRHDDYHYIAMEYLAGGPLLGKEGLPRPVEFALRITREIAGAIGYAQQKGFIHRDIKPDNILLRDDGSAVLTDFGIARASDSGSRMTRTGTIVGTPHYMSPEQARGKRVDGRSDLYSLGIVLHEMLVGYVPYSADDSLAVGIMHISKPLPLLPAPLAALQPLLDSLLAKDPSERFQAGSDAVAAIEELERAINAGELPDLVTEPVDSSTVPRTGASTQVQDAHGKTRRRGAATTPRAEPSLGRLHDVVTHADAHVMRAQRSSPPAAVVGARRVGYGWAVMGVLVAGLAFGLWTYQEHLRALLPRTELNVLLTRAQAALAQGHLTGSQGDSARELFQTARALEPDNNIARAGLNSVGEGLLVQARAALARGDLDAARQSLSAARDLLGGGEEVQALERDVEQSEGRLTEVESVLDAARMALDKGQILGGKGALAEYQRVLRTDQDNALARAGVDKSLQALARQARQAMAVDDLALADTRIEDIARVQPEHASLPELRAGLSQQRELQQAALERDLESAEAQLRRGQFSDGASSAQALFAAALARDPGNTRALAGLQRVAQGLVVQANAAIEDSNVGSAERLLDQATQLAPDLADLYAARISLRELRERLDIAASRPTLDAAATQRLRTLVDEAQQAAAAGKITLPPGDSAYDKYRAALALDRDDPAALEGLRRLAGQAMQAFDLAVSANEPFRALASLDAVRQIAPAEPGVDGMASRLASLFMTQADRRISEGRRQDAERALNAARELTPQDPRVDALQQRLRGLGSGSS